MEGLGPKMSEIGPPTAPERFRNIPEASGGLAMSNCMPTDG